MLYLDQRGTGLSTPVTASTLQMRGELPLAYEPCLSQVLFEQDSPGTY